MKRRSTVLYYFAILLCSGWRVTEGMAQNAAERHVAAAKAAAYQSGHNFTAVFETLCIQPKPADSGARPAERNPLPLPTAPRSEWFAEPAKVFDNLYYSGEE